MEVWILHFKTVCFCSFHRTGIDVENAAAGEPAANVLLQQMIQQINCKVTELTGEDMFPIRLKLTDFSKELMVSDQT